MTNKPTIGAVRILQLHNTKLPILKPCPYPSFRHFHVCFIRQINGMNFLESMYVLLVAFNAVFTLSRLSFYGHLLTY